MEKQSEKRNAQEFDAYDHIVDENCVRRQISSYKIFKSIKRMDTQMRVVDNAKIYELYMSECETVRDKNDKINMMTLLRQAYFLARDA